MRIHRLITRPLVSAALLSLLPMLSGCGGGGAAPPPTGGAGIPGVRGPAAPNAKVGAKAAKGAPKPGPAAR